MSWKEKIVSFATGKNKTERLQERAANIEIRKKQMAAYYQAKQKEDIRIAQTRAKIEADARIKQIQNRYNPPKQSFSSPFGGGFGSSFNPIIGNRPIQKPKVVYRYKPIKKRVKKTRTRYVKQDNYKPYSIWG